jgi:hypothetical protein
MLIRRRQYYGIPIGQNGAWKTGIDDQGSVFSRQETMVIIVNDYDLFSQVSQKVQVLF